MGKCKKNNSVFKIKQLQPSDCVTCSSVLIEVDGIKILLDLGLIQDSTMTFKQLYHINMQKLQSIPYDELDYVVVSHSHFDHASGLGVLAREESGFKGTIIATELTADLSKIIMEDAQRINQSDVAKANQKEGKNKYRTFYDKEDVVSVMQEIRCYNYNQQVRLSDKVTLELLPACHLPGASMIYITYVGEYKTERLLYTGDITFGHTVDRPFTKKIEDKTLKVDILICESTYGLRDRQELNTISPIDYLEEAILREVVQKNKTLWIPSFAVHRATSLYLYLYQIMQRNEEIKKANIPIYFCGKMMNEAHNTIGKDKYNCYYDEQWVDKKDIFRIAPFGFLFEKKDVEHFCYNNTRKIVISSSGMFDKGYSSLLAESYVANGKVSALACGYMGDNTLGQQIRDGEEYAMVNGIKKKVRCSFAGTIPNMSGHASHQGLIDFVKSLNQSVLKNIVLVHGTEEAKKELKEDLEKELKSNKKVYIPKQFETLNF